MKKLFKNVAIATFAIALFLGGFILYTFYITEAPITKGEHEHFKYSEDFGLDIYYPTIKRYNKAPILFYIHGGAWIIGSKITVNNNRFHGAFNSLRDQGFAIISPDYTLAKKGHSPFPDCIYDIKNAIEWVYEQGNSKGLDLNRIGILGESAGSHIAMMTAYDPIFSKTYPVDYLVNIYGPTSLYKLYLDQKPLMSNIQNSVSLLPESMSSVFDLPSYLFGYQPEKDTIKSLQFADTFSPTNMVGKHIDFPTLIIHGKKDRVVPFNQSEILIEKLEKLNLEYELHSLENVDHAFRGITAENKTQVQTWISDFVLKHYN